jgi:SpoVK/Ycf46/Vps4 family AAA+-type ATPase
MPFLSISAPSIVSGMSGESEKTLRDIFEEAKVRRHRSFVIVPHLSVPS